MDFKNRQEFLLKSEECDFSIILPFPPSINTIYPIVRGRKILSKNGRLYKKEVENILSNVEYTTLTGNLSMFISLTVPDRRRRDIDNYNKAVLDCLTEQHVYGDDSQIVYLTVEKSGPIKVDGKNLLGTAEIMIWEH